MLKTDTAATKEAITEIVARSCDVILTLIMAAADTRADAIRGAEALHRDMLRNINEKFDEMEKV